MVIPTTGIPILRPPLPRQFPGHPPPHPPKPNRRDLRIEVLCGRARLGRRSHIPSPTAHRPHRQPVLETSPEPPQDDQPADQLHQAPHSGRRLTRPPRRDPGEILLRHLRHGRPRVLLLLRARQPVPLVPGYPAQTGHGLRKVRMHPQHQRKELRKVRRLLQRLTLEPRRWKTDECLQE